MLFLIFLINAALAGIAAGFFVYHAGKKKKKSGLYAAYSAGLAVFQLLYTVAMLVNVKF